MATFTLSCFGLLLFLWASFGGAVPLKPRGFEFKASFAEATQLAQEADLRISGVRVGKVKKIGLGDNGRTEATIELERKYAPPPSDSKAILRQKTLLGETYVEMTPGTKGAPPLPEGATLAVKNVAPTVELDEILRSFDAKTRQAFQVWQQSVALGIAGRAQDFSDTLANLEPFADDTNAVLEILNSQSRATKLLIRNTGEFFAALTRDDGELADLIQNSNRVFATTAERDDQIRGFFRALPEFIDQSKLTLRRLQSYAANTNPLITELHPWARAASDTFESVNGFAPDFNRFMQALGPAVTASKSGFPAGTQFLDELRPLLAQLDPFLRNFNPFLRYLGTFKREFAAFFANMTAATNYNDRPGTPVRAIRLSIPANPESFAPYPRRIGPNRGNAYFQPGAYDLLRLGLNVFSDANCSRGGYPNLPAPDANFSADLRDRIFKYYWKGTFDGVTPACRQQGKTPFGGETTDFPHVREDPRP